MFFGVLLVLLPLCILCHHLIIPNCGIILKILVVILKIPNCALYQGMAGQPRGQAIVSFMAIVESLPTYGVHYYEVRDKHGTTWWLGLSPQGIAVYPQHDKYDFFTPSSHCFSISM